MKRCHLCKRQVEAEDLVEHVQECRKRKELPDPSGKDWADPAWRDGRDDLGTGSGSRRRGPSRY